MAKNKTTETTESVTKFINAVIDPVKRADSFKIIELMQAATGFEPKMWGPSIIGFGSCHYQYESGHEGDAPLIGFSPRAAAITLYLASTFPRKEALLQQFGKHKTGKSCVYFKKLGDVDLDILKEMIRDSVDHVKGGTYSGC